MPETATSSGARITEKARDSKGTITIVGPRRASLRRDPFNSRTYRFTCDFQMVKKQGEIEERRILLQSNVKSAPKGTVPPDAKRYSSLKPLFAPIDILAGDHQGLYEFRLMGREVIKGRASAVIEAVARPGSQARIPAAKIWIDPESTQILRCETQGLPVEGYEFIFEEASRIGISPVGVMTVSYGEEKNGVLFPSRVTLLIEYPVNIWGVGKRTRVDTDIRYDQYRFFTVETEKAVIR
jgi:hypothetical protein